MSYSHQPGFFSRLASRFSRKSTKININKTKDFSNNANEISGDYEYRIAEQQVEKLLKTPRHTKTSNTNNNDRILRSRINKIMKKMERFNAIEHEKRKKENMRFLAGKRNDWQKEEAERSRSRSRIRSRSPRSPRSSYNSLQGVPKKSNNLEERFFKLTGRHTTGHTTGYH